ncbi:TraR/DksA C4-type zinc finger protein [Aquihabitans sp. G128]|uniref:TraR/DksA family transcriptional regulator n=1 Tax=Aquihabitans sp. G128 TaxID=2849779 RepID=UPI001C232D1C|nr:TraR/DksA C4-type zinc finger protein [Aquihabitans sp. G128]QXC62020.1 TraR/DksA C4-type zinc finger protein [Aquihabitans sp. G128]
MSTTDQTKLRTDLDAERADLQRQLDELEKDGSEAPDFDENFADSAQVAAGHGENLTLAAQFREQLGEVEAAMGRLDEGTYGTCEVCGTAIGADRLDAMPATRFCIDHA